MRALAAAAALVLLVTTGCAADPQDPGLQPESRETSDSPSETVRPETQPDPEPEPEPGSTQTLPPVNSPVSLPALMREKFRAGRVQQVRVVAETDAYTRSEVTYRSGDVTVSGILLRPRGPGPFPGVVLNHGYIDPSFYVTGQGLAREQDWLARAGFVVLHTDYRGHAASDPAAPLERESRLGYTRDAIHAVLALEREPYVDPEKMAMLGRSMGGGVTLNALVAQPDLVEAAVIYASVSSRYLDNLRQFTLRSRPDAARALFDRFGTPDETPEFYAALSPRTYFDRINDPILMHHGTDDETCPFRWATTTQRLLERAGASSSLDVYDGEMHAFIPQWRASIERTVQFLRRQFNA